MRRRGLAAVVAAVVFISATSIRAGAAIETMTVGNPCNASDTRHESPGYGGVSYVYSIGKFEITAGQYTEFLNAVAATMDTHGLYDASMADLVAHPGGRGCGIQRSGSEGSYTYSVAPDWADRPVNYVSWGDAARFVNWLHNGQPTGVQEASTTEDGSYHLNGAMTNAELLTVVREFDATWVIPSEDEWYKAAHHYNECGPAGHYEGYYDFPTSFNSTPGCIDDSGNLTRTGSPFTEGGIDPSNTATYDCDAEPLGTWGIGPPYFRTEVGEHENSPSPYGTFDQGGNVWEWNEAVLIDAFRGLRGGAYYQDTAGAAWTRYFDNPSFESSGIGFRVANVSEPVPEDLDHDGDVDLYDYALFQAAVNGPR